MGTTPQHRLPYPEPSDLPDIQGDMKALALATDTALTASEKVSPVFPSIMLSKKAETAVQQHGWYTLLFPDLHNAASNTHPSFFGQKHGGVEVKKPGLYLTEFQGKLNYGAGTDAQWKSIFCINLRTGADVWAETVSQQIAITPHNLGLTLAHLSSINWIQAGYVVTGAAYTYFGVTGFPKHAQHSGDYPSYLRVTYLGPIPTGQADPTPPRPPQPDGPGSPEGTSHA